MYIHKAGVNTRSMRRHLLGMLLLEHPLRAVVLKDGLPKVLIKSEGIAKEGPLKGAVPLEAIVATVLEKALLITGIVGRPIGGNLQAEDLPIQQSTFVSWLRYYFLYSFLLQGLLLAAW